MAKYDVGPCSCGHTFKNLEAANQDEALEKAADLAPEHIEQFHRDDPAYAQLKGMTRAEFIEMMRPMVHAFADVGEPAFRESLEDEL